MRNAGGEIPEIADADIVDEIAPLRIDRGDSRRTVKHVGPFAGLVPMQLAHAAGVEAHVHAGDVLGNAKLTHRHLAGPAAELEPHVGIVERVAQVRKRAVVGRRRREQVGILAVAHQVSRTGIGAAGSGTLGLRQGFGGLGTGRCHSQKASGCCGGEHIAAGDGIHDFLQSCWVGSAGAVMLPWLHQDQSAIANAAADSTTAALRPCAL